MLKLAAKDSRRLWNNIHGLKGNLVEISKVMVCCENHHITTANLVYNCILSRQFLNETFAFGKQTVQGSHKCRW